MIVIYKIWPAELAAKLEAAYEKRIRIQSYFVSPVGTLMHRRNDEKHERRKKGE